MSALVLDAVCSAMNKSVFFDYKDGWYKCINKTTQTRFHVHGVLKMVRPCLRHWLISGGKTKPSGFSCPALLSVKRDFVLSQTAFPRDSAMSLCSQGNAGHLLNLLSYSGCTMILSYISKIVFDLFRHKVKSKSLIVCMSTDKQLIAFVRNLAV